MTPIKTIDAVSKAINNESFWNFTKVLAKSNPILSVVFIISVLLILVYALKIILKHFSKKDCDVKVYNFELLISQIESIKELFDTSQESNKAIFNEIQDYMKFISKHIINIDKIPAAFKINTLELISKIQEWQNRG